LEDLVRAGKIREIGSSNFSAEQILQAEGAVRAPAARFVSVQNEYSVLHRAPERGVLAECVRHGIGFLPYFPLASGLLSGKYQRGKPLPTGARLSVQGSPITTRFLSDERFATTEALTDFARSRGHSLLELAHSWLLAQKPVASVITGATSVEQVQANAAAANWQLTSDELREIDRIAPARG
jgi:aryl-alcohol dehydrogenase-like predicted oxidoreductase